MVSVPDQDQYRILTPSEYFRLRVAIPKTVLRMCIDVLCMTGMRYSESKAFGTHPEWFDEGNRVIVVPAAYTKTRRNRNVHLTSRFAAELGMYLRENKEIVFPDNVTMNRNLIRWLEPIPDIGWVRAKTFRKTWESWLLAAGYDSLQVALSQGHTQTIQLNHYANMSARLKSEMDAVKAITAGWGE